MNEILEALTIYSTGLGFFLGIFLTIFLTWTYHLSRKDNLKTKTRILSRLCKDCNNRVKDLL